MKAIQNEKIMKDKLTQLKTISPHLYNEVQNLYDIEKKLNITCTDKDEVELSCQEKMKMDHLHDAFFKAHYCGRTNNANKHPIDYNYSDINEFFQHLETNDCLLFAKGDIIFNDTFWMDDYWKNNDIGLGMRLYYLF